MTAVAEPAMPIVDEPIAAPVVARIIVAQVFSSSPL